MSANSIFLTCEFEAAICFLVSFLYGRIPRTRIEEWAEILGNQMLMHLRGSDEYYFLVNVNGECHFAIEEAINALRLRKEDFFSFLPNNLILVIKKGSVVAEHAVRGEQRTIYPDDNDPTGVVYPKGALIPKSKVVKNEAETAPFLERVFCSCSDGSVNPLFKLTKRERSFEVYKMASFRFGWAKPRMHRGLESGLGNHEFTSPSMLSYLRLFKSLLIILRATEDYEVEGGMDENKDRIPMTIEELINLSPLMIWAKEKEQQSLAAPEIFNAKLENVYNVTDDSDIEIVEI